MDKNVSRVQRTWHKLGEIDPMWAILTDPSKLGFGWTETDFFESGEREIAAVIAKVDRLAPGRANGRACDFGCGIGRLSRALAHHYDRVDGVDVAPSMIARAREGNPHRDRCFFHLNEAPDLRIFEDASFDLVYSNIVLQHMEPSLALQYISEFARCTKPGGAIVFQVPHVRRFNAASLRRYGSFCVKNIIPHYVMKRYRQMKHKTLSRAVIDNLPNIPMEMNALHRKRIEKNLGERCRLLHVEDTSYGEKDAFVSYTYVFQKI